MYSDGAFAPRDVVASAARGGVRLLALSDHDSVAGVQEALDAAREYGVRLVPAVEISALGATGQDLHVLGYLLDHRDPELLERLRGYRDAREHRPIEMSAALR